MCDSVSSTSLLLPFYSIGSPNSSFSRCTCIPRIVRTQQIFTCNWDRASSRNGGSPFISACFRSNEAETKIRRNSIPTESSEYDFYGELGFMEKGKEQIELETAPDDKIEKGKSKREKRIDIGSGTKVDGPSDDPSVSSGVNFIEFNGENGAESVGRLKDENLVRTEEGCDGVGSKLEELEQSNVGSIDARRGRQLTKRSNLLAKQVISIQSALSLGFVSQLWVDTVSWVVLIIEVRPNLLSGELERFFLEDISQVGDVVLIPDENVMENELKMVGLETLVGYNVVTPGRQNIGKVRGYNFSINSGAVESLELDSFGMSIIPSSLVSTYALLVEDVLEVVSDTVVVHEAAASSIQRLTKQGFWDSQKLGKSIDELGDYSDLKRQPVQFDHGRSKRRSFNSRKFRPKTRECADDWELPMDYL
ncbi:unnamed protein product [Camellia sinensis]